MGELSALETVLEIVADTRNGASENAREIDDKNQIKTQFVSSQIFHRTPGERVQKTTAGERFKPRTLESYPTTQKPYWGSPAMIHTKTDNPNSDDLECGNRFLLKLSQAGDEVSSDQTNRAGALTKIHKKSQDRPTRRTNQTS
jgi:hypothetical protein